VTDQHQSPLTSLVEASTNVVIGYLLALATQRLLFPMFGIVTTIGEDIVIAAIFALTSLIRSYALRRLFQFIEHHRHREREERARSLERRFASGKL
jgi:cytochrome b subunit of formate dehydrogenase